MKRYEKLAAEIAEAIRSGVLAKGEKLPSVRHTGAARALSASTVFQAYYLLEAQGLIVARERSGYYVNAGSSQLQPHGVQESVRKEASTVDVSELVFEILEATRAREGVALGSAFPSPLLFPLDKLAACMSSSVKAMDPWLTVKDLSPGDLELRRQIAQRYLSDGLVVAAEDIVITNGALEALNLCLSAVTRPGDTVLIEAPAFYACLQAVEQHGLKAVEITGHPQQGVDLEAMRQAILQHRPKACWLMTSFQNPTGSLMPQKHKRALVDLLTEHQIPLIEDDVYGELYFGTHKPLPAKAYDHAGLVMHCSSFSKCLAPGYRVGWVAAGRYARQVERLKLTSSLATSVPAQQALARYLTKGGYDRHLRQLRHQLLLQQIRFMEGIASYFPAETRISKPDGGYFLWLKLPGKVDALELYRHALANQISIAPGPMFSAHHEFRDYIRLNYGHGWNAETARALQWLGAFVRDAQKKNSNE
ncbi:PLP-dependent aminotransferase family protein [Methylobacillus flagellatus]|uniref:aminotransferase-like domain-containing protein n=1 Tax=Methylobacillus flagellatus TaxID=405 RepID=UPI0010F9D95B|nr:PLP-dependent aminotransferase family protein [Methylobacillus flagellatus]